MIIAALTGSIGMGKTTTAAMFAECGAAVWDADKAVHRLYRQGGLAVSPVGAAFPTAIFDNAVDRDRLAKAVLSDPEALKRLEAIVHPLVGQDRKAFIDQARLDQKPITIVDVPLLFETGGDAFVDAIIVVSCPPEVQRQRVLARPGMTESKFDLILARQTPDAEKRKRADFVIETGRGLESARAQVGDVYQELLVRSQKSMD